MKQENLDFITQLALIREKDDRDALRKVLDPLDTKGVKNSYIDVYLKYYITKYLFPQKEDIVLEVGCGIGRLTEHIAHSVRTVYGIDIVDALIDACNANPGKGPNTHYVKMSDREELKLVPINKIYIVWVLMLITDREELIQTLRTYRNLVPNLQTMTVLEQVKQRTQEEGHRARFSAVYRTIDEYREIFRASGFTVKDYFVLAERHHGPFYKLIHFLYKALPRALAKAAPRLFLIDKYIMGNNPRRMDLINNKRPTDVVFQLEVVDGKRE